MEEIQLDPKKRYIKITEQLEELGYTVWSRYLPKYLAVKDGKVFWVAVTPLYKNQQLMEDQKKTLELLEEKPDVLLVRMP